jgi:hypothetical protein
MADTKLSALTALTAITGDDGLYVVDDMDGTPVSKSATAAVLRNFTGMAYAAYSTDADLSAAVNTLYVADISGFTANRNLTLPATAAVGDRVGLFISTGDDAYEFIVKANTGDTLNGVSAAEWSRLFIANECIIMRCIVADSTWIVEYDGRIPCNTAMEAASQQTGIADSAWVTITKGASGSWATPINVGACADATNHAVITRRAGNYVLSAGVAIEALIDARSILIGFRKNATGSPKRCGRLDTGYNVSTLQIVGSVAVAAAAGDSYDAQVLHLDATTTRNTEYIAGESMSTIRLVEVL